MKLFRNTDFFIKDTFEHAFSPIPKSRRKPAGALMVVLAGMAFSTSGMSIGLQIGLAMPFPRALAVCLAGNLLLFLTALFWGLLGCWTGYASVALVNKLLGNRVSVAFAVIVILVTSMWVGMSGNLIAELLISSVPGWKLPAAVTTLAAVAVCVLFSANGWQSMELVSILAFPVLVLLTIYNLMPIGELNGGFDFLMGYQPEYEMTSVAAITSVMGNYILSATTMPDICRFAKNEKVVVFSVGVYALVLAISDVCGILIAQMFGANNLTYGIYLLGMAVPSFIWIVLCTYTTQNVNMYTGGLAIQKLVRRTTLEGNISHRTAMLFMGGFSVIVGVFDGSRYLMEVTRGLLVVMIPLTVISLAGMLLKKQQKWSSGWMPLILWMFGIAAGSLVWLMMGRIS